MSPPRDWTFKEIDASLALPKGSAFRAFKQIENDLCEGVDYYYLHGTRDADAVEALRLKKRLYRTSVHAVLLAPRGRDRLLAALAKNAGLPAK